MVPWTERSEERFNPELGRLVWETRYRRVEDGEVRERTLEESWRRVARAVAAVEGAEGCLWAERFYGALAALELLPGGRIVAGAGTSHRVTLFNCFVMGLIEDSIDGIFEALKEGALTMQQGGGVGYDFSTLRPRGLPARTAGTVASGPVSFMKIWDAMCATLLSTGARRGAMMGTLRCDHPDVERFIEAKRVPGALSHFNLAVQVSDALLDAVRRDDAWPLVFPVPAVAEGVGEGEVVRDWPGQPTPLPCRVLRVVPARELWERIVRSSYESGEPGVLFIDRINRLDNLGYRERISATNPCGEVPLPPYGACVLASLNLPRFVRNPFFPEARLDLERLASTTALAVRFLDDVIDVSRFPLKRQAAEVRGSRWLGLGVTGLADALVLLGLPYDGREARSTAALAVRTVCHAARTVADLEPADHLEMQAALQPYVDGAISKTVNVPEDLDLAAFRDLFRRADEAGLKGLTVFRPSPARRGVLSLGPPEAGEVPGAHEAPCCEVIT